MATAEMEAPAEATEDVAARVAVLEGLIAAGKAARVSAEERYRASKAELTAEIKSLEEQKRELTRSRRRARGPLDAHKQAGKRNIAAMLASAKKAGAATQAELASASGVGTGSTTWAIRALVEDGLLVETAERRGGSKVFQYVAPPKRVSKSRTLEPGA